MGVKSYQVLSEQSLGQGGFLTLRRMRMRAALDDGSLTREGLYDFVERPMGLDAVVLALWTRGDDGRVRVLLRDGVRIPLVFGRPGEPPRLRFTEVVAGILERGEDGAEAIRQRAADEAHEEAGLRVDAARIAPLGPPMFPTPGMCPELFHLVECEVSREQAAAAVHPPGDGSPFEEGAAVRWVALEDALAACARGEIQDMKTELILRRLADRVTVQRS
jgi:ADP-ribose pyrophosphatase